MATGMAGRPALRERLSSDRVLQAVLLITAVGLLARVVGLGTRVAHQDEARVAYWTLRHAQSGVFEYRPIIHGPFLPIVDSWVMRLLGPSDFSARVVVALIGGALPIVALLYRGRLRDPEVVGLAALFAANPVLLYYSRFFRSDMIVVTFAMLSLGAFVRTYDTRNPRYLYLAAASLAVAMTAKENALLYPVCWLGALGLLFDHRLFLARVRESSPPTVARDTARDTVVGLWHWRWPLVRATLAFLAVIVFFYAPRGGGYGGYVSDHGVGLWRSLELLVFEANPSMFLAVLEQATVGTVDTFANSTWSEPHGNDYITFFSHFVNTLREGAVVVVALSVVGFLYDRYASDGARPVVAMAFYWGAVSVFGYPMATDIRAAWVTTHAIAPLAIPAAVGLGLIWRWGEEAFVDEDGAGVAIAMILLLLLAAFVGVSAYGQVYETPQEGDNQLVQYAQTSSTDMKAVLNGPVSDAAAGNEGVDVVFYGQEFNSNDEAAAKTPAAAGGGWFDRLPFAWYFEIHQDRMGDDGFAVNSTADPEDFARTDPERLPPVVITLADKSYYGAEATESDITQYLEGYRRFELERYSFRSAVAVYVRADWQAYADVESRLNRSNESRGEGPVEFNVTTNGTSTDGPDGPGQGAFGAPGPDGDRSGTAALAGPPAVALAARRRPSAEAARDPPRLRHARGGVGALNPTWHEPTGE